MKNKQDAAKLRQKWAETHVGPIERECGHAVLNVSNGVVVCLQCGAKRLEESA